MSTRRYPLMFIEETSSRMFVLLLCLSGFVSILSAETTPPTKPKKPKLEKLWDELDFQKQLDAAYLTYLGNTTGPAKYVFHLSEHFDFTLDVKEVEWECQVQKPENHPKDGNGEFIQSKEKVDYGPVNFRIDANDRTYSVQTTPIPEGSKEPTKYLGTYTLNGMFSNKNVKVDVTAMPPNGKPKKGITKTKTGPSTTSFVTGVNLNLVKGEEGRTGYIGTAWEPVPKDSYAAFQLDGESISEPPPTTVSFPTRYSYAHGANITGSTFNLWYRHEGMERVDNPEIRNNNGKISNVGHKMDDFEPYHAYFEAVMHRGVSVEGQTIKLRGSTKATLVTELTGSTTATITSDPAVTSWDVFSTDSVNWIVGAGEGALGAIPGLALGSSVKAVLVAAVAGGSMTNFVPRYPEEGNASWATMASMTFLSSDTKDVESNGRTSGITPFSIGNAASASQSGPGPGKVILEEVVFPNGSVSDGQLVHAVQAYEIKGGNQYRVLRGEQGPIVSFHYQVNLSGLYEASNVAFEVRQK